jgi:hypothetical protein
MIMSERGASLKTIPAGWEEGRGVAQLVGRRDH